MKFVRRCAASVAPLVLTHADPELSQVYDLRGRAGITDAVLLPDARALEAA